MLIKRTVRDALVWPPLNAMLKRYIKPFAHKIPHHIVQKIPVRGPVTVSLPSGKNVRFESDGRDVYATLLFWHGPYGVETQTMRILPRLLRSATTFFDIGANTGTYALYAAVDDPQRQVYAFEPVPEVFEYLATNIAANGLKNIHAVQGAVGEYTGTLTLHVHESLRLPAGASGRELYEAGTQVQAPIVTLDQFVAEQQIEHVDLLKIDTETTEPDVLRGAHAVLRQHQPLIICEVLYQQTESELHNVLDGAEYDYYLITEHGLEQRLTIVGDEHNGNINYLFVPQSKRAAVADLIVDIANGLAGSGETAGGKATAG